MALIAGIATKSDQLASFGLDPENSGGYLPTARLPL
jgi:hypothetical protein